MHVPSASLPQMFSVYSVVVRIGSPILPLLGAIGLGALILLVVTFYTHCTFAKRTLHRTRPASLPCKRSPARRWSLAKCTVLTQATETNRPAAIRNLFSIVMFFYEVSCPADLWYHFKEHYVKGLSESCTAARRNRKNVFSTGV